MPDFLRDAGATIEQIDQLYIDCIDLVTQGFEFFVAHNMLSRFGLCRFPVPQFVRHGTSLLAMLCFKFFQIGDQGLYAFNRHRIVE